MSRKKKTAGKTAKENAKNESTNEKKEQFLQDLYRFIGAYFRSNMEKLIQTDDDTDYYYDWFAKKYKNANELLLELVPILGCNLNIDGKTVEEKLKGMEVIENPDYGRIFFEVRKEGGHRNGIVNTVE
jgi:hypothetical protein